jgi:hypothetical protein
MVTAQMVVEDEMTQKRTQKLPPSVLPVRPGDGVRPLPPPPPPQSSPDMLIPPPPLSSSRALVPSGAPSAPPALSRPSYGEILARPSATEAVTSTDVPAPGPNQGLTNKQKITLAVGAPVLAAMLIASFLVGGGVESKRSAAAPQTREPAPKKAAPVVEPPPLVAPVVIAPPEPVEDAPDASAKNRPGPRPRSSAAK